MKYIKLFEQYNDMFDYNINHIEEILKIQNVDFVDITYLDSGSYGSVFDLNNGNVLKITNMDSEIYYAKKLIDIESECLVKVENVFFHKYYDMGYNVKVGFIIMEKLITEKGKQFKNFLDYLTLHGTIRNIYKTINNRGVLKYFKDKLIYTTDEKIIYFWEDYKTILSECEKYKLPIDDLRGRNIGFRNNKPVFFDIGDIYNSHNHDYSDIEIINHNINI